MDRTKYKEIISSIKIPEGTSSEKMLEMLKPLNIALIQMIPERLYKYRSCSDNHIKAFEKDEMWMSTSDLFNDPFDTLIQYDEEGLKAAIDAVSKPEIFETLTKHIANGGQMASPINMVVDKDEKERLKIMAAKALAEHTLTCPDNQQLCDVQALLSLYIKLLPEVVQRFSAVACFTEDIKSILMWSHYSCNHTGFALGYDLRPMLLPNEKGLGLYPVIYGEKRYDASEFLFYLLGKLLNIPVHNSDMMSQIKLLIYKSTEWRYEQEWRLISSEQKNLFKGRAEAIQLKPNSIYYGCKISEEKYQELHDIAQAKGIEEHFITLDNASDSYRMKVDAL